MQDDITANLDRVRRSPAPRLAAFRILQRRHALLYVFQDVEPVEWILVLFTAWFVASLQWPNAIFFGLSRYDLTLEKGLPLPFLLLWWLAVALKVGAFFTGNEGLRRYAWAYASTLWAYAGLTILADVGWTVIGGWMLILVAANLLAQARRFSLRDGSGRGGE